MSSRPLARALAAVAAVGSGAITAAVAIVVAGAVVAGAVLAGAVFGATASGPAPDRAPHLLVVAAEDASAAELSRAGTEVVARYAAFTVVEAAGEDAERLRRAGAELRDDMRAVRIGGRSLDPAADRAPLVSKGERPSGPGLALVQFVGPIKDGWLERLRKTGVRVVTYMAQNAYLVHGSGEQLGRLGDLVGSDPAVRAVVPYTVADKLGAGVGRGAGVEQGPDVEPGPGVDPSPGAGPATEQRLAVQTLSGADGASARVETAGAGRELRDASAVGPFRTQFVELGAARAADIARDPGVVSIQRAIEPRLRDERASQIVADSLNGGDPLVPTGPGYLPFYDALGLGPATFPFTVDVTDEGLDSGTTATSHPDLHEQGALAQPSRIGYADNFTADADGKDCGGHGTINAGIIGGYNDATGSGGAGAVEDAEGYNHGLGVAPRSKVGGSKIFRCADGAFNLTGSFTALTANAYAKGARISSNSWTADVGGAYTADSQEYDRLVRDADAGTAGNQQMVEVFAAGNAGRTGANTLGSPATAKNVISVGASEGVRASGTDGCGATDAQADDARDLAIFSSRGPTDDGRVKPDVVGPGTHIVGARPQHTEYNGSGVCNAAFPAGSTLYSLSSGTSHSTPVLAGMAAVLREWYRQKKGGGTAVPSPALTKAVLAGSATDAAGGEGVGGNHPNQNQGWGLANLRRALDSGPRFFHDQDEVLGASGTTFRRTFAVQSTAQPVRVTMAFTDSFGPTTGNSYVNDLNLRVAAGSGTFKGNVFAGGRSVTGGSADPRNNLESVYLPAGTSGNFTVEVTGANIAGDGVPGNADPTDQDFAFTVSNAAEAAAPVLSEETASVAERAGDGDGAVEPGEGFSLSEEIKNVGTAAATGVAGTLAGPAQVSIDDASAAWPNLAPGQSAANSDPLAGSLSAGAPCGTPVALSLQVSGSGGSGFTQPVLLDTGRTGPMTERESSDVPRAIPDNDPTGVTSTLAVAQAGPIKDLDVRIESLTHTWVGDLRIELTAPDGTVATLLDRPGGVNNGDDNLFATVLDDEATTSIGAGGTAAPYSGVFQPQVDPLSKFDGKPSQGSWTLRVSDLSPQDVGSLTAWGHDTRVAECSPMPASPPGPIAGLTARGAPASVVLDWGDAASASEYEVFRRNPDGSYPATATASPAASQLTDRARVGGVAYCYKVRALDGGRPGPLSDEVCATALPLPPRGIAALTATSGPGSVALDWADTASASGYEVFRRNPDGTYPPTATASPAASQFTDTGRLAGVAYCYKVRAVNAGGAGPLSGEVCAAAAAEPPGAITGLSAAGQPLAIRLSWAEAPTATKYYVFRRNEFGYPWLPTATVTASRHDDPGRTAGVQECYKVEAVNAAGSGPLSDEACATPLSAGDGGSGGGGGGGPGGDPKIPVLPILDLSAAPRSIAVDARGRFSYGFRATPAAGGSLTMTTVKALASAAPRKRKLVLVHKRFTVPASGRVKLRAKLGKQALRVLRRTRKLGASTVVELGARSAKRRVTLHAPRRKRR